MSPIIAGQDYFFKEAIEQTDFGTSLTCAAMPRILKSIIFDFQAAAAEAPAPATAAPSSERRALVRCCCFACDRQRAC